MATAEYQVPTPNKDHVVVSDPPKDTSITTLRWCPNDKSNLFAVGSWDGQLRLYKHTGKGVATLIDSQKVAKPILGIAWDSLSHDSIYGVGADNSIFRWDITRSFCGVIPNTGSGSVPIFATLDSGKSSAMASSLSSSLSPSHANTNTNTNTNSDDIWNTAEKISLSNSFGFDSSNINVNNNNNMNRLISSNINSNMNLPHGMHHQLPIKCVEYVKDNQMLITGSWDKTVKFWDQRASYSTSYNQNMVGQCMQSINLENKVYSMCSLSPWLVIGLSNKHIQTYDLRKYSNGKYFSDKTTPLKQQIRCMDIFPQTKDGYAVASVEGRCAIEHFENTDSRKNFSFKCHRHAVSSTGLSNANSGSSSNNQNVFGVNCLRFHKLGTFATGGGDGGINIWDRIGRQRLKHYQRLPLPIVDLDFSSDGNFIAYAISYDWSQGANKYNVTLHQPQIYLHALEQHEVDRFAPRSSR